MAENIRLNEGVGGDIFAADDIGGVKYGRSKIVIGADGVNDGDVSASNPMPVVQDSYGVQSSSSYNTTTDTLSGEATFTGQAEQNDYSWVMASCYADVGGTLYFDFSADGVNWRTFPTSGFVVSAGVHKFQTALKGPRYFRARYVNGSSAQSTFQLYTYYGDFGHPSAPLNQAIGRDAEAQTVRPTDPQDEISIGLRSGVSQFNKFGYKENSTSAGGDELIWPLSTASLTILSTASTFTIAYNNSTDGLGTTGALQLTFYYLDANGYSAVSAHTLSNTGSDVTSFSGLGINRIAVSSSGAATVNTSAITITATTGGSNQAYVPAGEGVTQQAILHVPTNAKALSKWLYIRCNKLSGVNPVVVFKGWVYNRNIQSKYLIYKESLKTADDQVIDITDPCNFPLSTGDVLYFTMDTDSNDTVAYIRFSANIYNNA